VNAYGSADGVKHKKTDTKHALPFSGKCAGGAFAAAIPPQHFARAPTDGGATSYVFATASLSSGKLTGAALEANIRIAGS
jgi:hypothetical protein